MYLSAEAYMLCMAMDCRIGPQHSKRYAHGMTLTDGTWEQVNSFFFFLNENYCS